MKIVINKCFGGFGLSHEAMELYCKLKGNQVYYEADPKHPSLGLGTYWLVPPDQRPEPIKDWSKASQEDRIAYNEAYNKCTIYDRDIERNDPLLVQVVETLGEQANGRFSELRVVEIPDGVSWEIGEYDGMESVEETHRSWG